MTTELRRRWGWIPVAIASVTAASLVPMIGTTGAQTATVSSNLECTENHGGPTADAACRYVELPADRTYGVDRHARREQHRHVVLHRGQSGVPVPGPGAVRRRR